MNITVGADPEVFLYDPEQNKHVSAIGLIGGTKCNPRKIPWGSVQEDNVACEFNVYPAGSVGRFNYNLSNVMTEVQKLVPKYVFSQKCTAEFSESELQHPHAKIAGCDPDYDAWRVKPNRSPNITLTNTRCAGGHVHVGFTIPEGSKREQQWYRVDMVRALDLTLGVPSIIMDTDTKRKELYGKAGAHRPTDYGVEYRVLSNFWIFKPETVKWVFRQVQRAVEWYQDRKFEIQAVGKDIQKCINTANKTMAEHMIKQFELEVV